MNIENSKSYKKRIKKRTPGSKIFKNSAAAFLTGGTVCLFGELISDLFSNFGMSEEDSYTMVTVFLIFLASILTGLGVFDKIARHAGAGTLLPVTGFANAVVSPALDTKSEGFILGVGAKIFTVAGPVILYGILSGTVLGIIYFITNLFL